MPCVGGLNCGQAVVMQMTSDGVSFGYCATHLEQAENFIIYGSQRPARVADVKLNDRDYVDDYVRIMAVMQCKELFLKMMNKFASETFRAQTKVQSFFDRKRGKTPHIPLTRSMEHYEGLCWFDTQKKVMSGLLTAEEFWKAIRDGYMVKDPGPGPDHGEFSHRLQWHYIMRVVTNDFTEVKAAPWKHTPLELFCGMGREGKERNVWGALLEGAPPMTGGPGDPGWVNRRFTEGELKATALGAAIGKRYDKRHALVEDVRQYLKGKHADTLVHDLATKPPVVDVADKFDITKNSVNIHSIIEFIYKWKISGAPDLSKVTHKNLNMRYAADIWRLPSMQKRFGKKTHGFHARDDGHGNISEGLLFHGAAYIKDTKTADDRMSASRAAFHTDYRYSPTLGAAPA